MQWLPQNIWKTLKPIIGYFYKFFLIKFHSLIFNDYKISVHIGFVGIFILISKRNNVIETFSFDYEDIDFNDIYNALLKYKNTRIYIFHDDPKQTIKVVSIPIFTGVMTNKMIKQFITKEYDDNQLVAYDIVNVYDKSAFDVWKINIITCAKSDQFKELLDIIAKLNLNIRGAYFVGFEAINLIHSIKAYLIANNPESLDPNVKVTILVTLYKASGLKFFIYIGKDLLFERTVAYEEHKSVSLNEGIIDNEIEEIVLNIKKRSEYDYSETELILLLRPKLLERYKTKHLNFIHTHLIHPQKLCMANNIIAEASEDSFLYPEIYTIFNFLKYKSFEIHNPPINYYTNLKTANHLIFKPFILIILLIVGGIGVLNYEKHFIDNQINILNKSYVTNNEKYNILKNKFKDLDIDKITDILFLQDSIHTDKYNPFDIIRKFLNINNEVNIISISWKNLKNDHISHIEPFFEIKLKYKSNNLNFNLQEEFTKYIERLKQVLPTYDITFTRLNEKIETSSLENFVPIKIILTSKKL